MERNVIIAYFIMAAIFGIVGLFLWFVHRLLKETEQEQEQPPHRKPSETDRADRNAA